VTEDPSKRFVSLVMRELGATSVFFREADDPPPEEAIVVELPDGRFVEVELASTTEDAEAMTRRLEMLVGAFEGLTQEGAATKRRDPPAISLRKELRSLVKRAQGSDAAVIDARSPVLWASASGEAKPEEEPDAETKTVHALRDRAIGELRALPQMEALHRGGHLALSVREDTFGYVVRSFAGIYVLFVVFDHAFDEIRGERALREALPRVERLVLALPPLDPEPVPAGVVALRPRRRLRAKK
jgi:hypothetical protein